MKESVKDLVESPFSASKFEEYLRETFHSADFSVRFEVENFSQRFKEFVKKADVVGEYVDENQNTILFITVELSRETTLERGRKAQRDFVAEVLDRYSSDGAVASFYIPNSSSWRLSLVVKRGAYDEHDKPVEITTTSKRFSFLLGEGEATKTTYLQISKIKNSPNPTLEELLDAFAVEKLNDEFFRRYLAYFRELWSIIYDQIKEKTEKPEKKSKEAAHQLLNRLTFIYFIQKKREWFKELKGKKLIDFLVENYKEYILEHPEKENTFYDKWLKPLFFSAFNGKRGEVETKYSYLPKDVKEFLKLAPYLNGGLFKENELDELPFTVPDRFFLKEDPFGKEDEGLIPFLNSYNFTIVEDLEDDRDVAVNPEFIGTVYEKLVYVDSEKVLKKPDEKGKDIEGVLKGIVYTKEPEIRFMVLQSLLFYLKKNTSLEEDTIYNFLFDDDFVPKDRKTFDALEKALNDLKVVDPACGSGAFLVGMVDTLYKLYEKLYRFDPEKVESGYAVRKRIIENNVYGVDVMEWAVRIAELRLWLFLLVESDIDEKEILIKPLLPNLSFNLRHGDSLIEELGDLDFSILRSKRRELRYKLQLPATLKGKVERLKKKKLAYAKNEKGAPSKSDIENEERSLYEEIIKTKKSQIKNKTFQLKQEIEQIKDSKYSIKDFFDEDAEKIEIKKLIKGKEEQLKRLEKELKLWERAEETLKKGKKPFIWDVDFVEVFYGDKGGFDIVIGNPPYVRQEKIAPPELNEEDFSETDWKELKREYKEKLQRMVENLYGKEFKPDKRADLYVYFYFKALSLLNERGTLAFITSNSWLDVGFGKKLQEFFLKRTKLHSINDNQSKRSFKEADVNTVIVFSGAPTDKTKEQENLENVAKFVMWKIPFEEVVNRREFKNYLKAINDQTVKVENAELTDLAENIVNKDEYRVFPVKQKDLLNDGMVNGKYEGNKWGGKFLRAPDIFFTILKKGRGKLVRLGDVAKVEGYIHDNNTGNKYPKVDFIKTVKDLSSIKLDESSEGVIPFGVKNSGKSRLLGDILFPRTLNDRHLIPIVFGKVFGKEFYKIIVKDKTNKINFGIQLNSTFAIFEREISE